MLESLCEIFSHEKNINKVLWYEEDVTALFVISLQIMKWRGRVSVERQSLCVCVCVCVFGEGWGGGLKVFGDYAKSGPVRRGGGAEGQTKTEEDAATGI